MIGIKDFGMPSCCVNCQMCDAYEKGTCVITDTECEDMYSQRNGDCPLVEITKSDDCVSREEAIKAIENVLAEYVIYFFFREEEAIPLKCTEALMSLPSVQPKPKTNVLDEIRTEIEQYQADCDLSCSDDANCRTCDRITFDSIYRIIDKYKKGDKK